MFVFRIKEVREKKNITLYKLSKLTGISRTYLTELENNKKTNPSLETMYKISLALNVSIRSLFYSTLDIEKLKQEMYKRIDRFGLNSNEVMEISHLIDLLINIEMKEKKV
ncbi:MAG: helix-turn-helix domain-containing protein [Clostridia bacterium]|nr:helix-turn-helix domain-containing protein [Clostridia bacterium]